MTELTKHVTSHDIYDDLRRRLISADFRAGQRMKSDDLRSNYACSASTIREVLFRLSCDGFLNFEDQKGFRTPVATLENLNELADLRVLLEQAGIRASIAKSDLAWEAQLTAAHHRLAHIEQKMKMLDDMREHVAIWTAAERAFHEALVSGASSQLLKSTHLNHFDRFRQLLATRGDSIQFGFRKGNIEEHAGIVNAALEKDTETCCDLAAKHIRATISEERNATHKLNKTTGIIS